MNLKQCIYAFVVLLTIMASSCNSPQSDAKPRATAASATATASAGASDTATAGLQLETLLKPTDGFVVSTLPVTTAKIKTINTPVKAYGVIEYDTRAAGTISARVAGRIEKMYVRHRYQPIEKGQKIMDIYSPDLLTAQQELLFLLKSDTGNASFIHAAKERLSLLGMGKGELEQVIRTGKPLFAVSIYSNYSGHVHDAGMINANTPPEGMNPAAPTAASAEAPVTQELSLKEGMYVQKGQPLLMIMNHHRVWAALQIFSNDQSLVKKGAAVSIIPEADTAAAINGHIDLIEPFFRDDSKTLTALVYFDNMDMLPIGSHVSADIHTDTNPALWLPQTAVLSLGMNHIAFMKTAGGFIVHKITTGIRSGDRIQVLSGLTEKDSVAVNAQYFIDSESFIKTPSK